MIAEENGKTIMHDTVLYGSDCNVYLYGSGDMDELEIDSILKKFNISTDDDLSVVKIDNFKMDKDSLKNCFIYTNTDSNDDLTEIKAHLYVTSDGVDESFEFSDILVDIDVDSIITIGEEGVTISEVIVDVNDKGKKYIEVFTTENDETSKIELEKLEEALKSAGENVTIYKSKTEDGEIVVKAEISGNDITDENIIIKSDNEGNIVTVSEVFVSKEGEGKKYIELNVDDDSKAEIIKLEEAFEGSDENVKIYKTKTDDGKLIVKIEISENDLTEEDKETTQKLGLDDKIKLDIENLNIFPNPTEGVFTIEFELENSANTLIKVYNQEGKSVFTKKIKKLEGLYSDKIDISKEDSGVYFIRIIQGDKSITKKILKK